MLIRTFLLGCTIAGAGCAVTLPEDVASSRLPPSQRDSDNDGVVDASDRCPENNETRNEHNDLDGCSDVRVPNRGMLVPGIIVTALGTPILAFGMAYTVVGLRSPTSFTDDVGEGGMGAWAVGLLAAAAIHFAVGIPLIVAGARDKHWSDDGTPVKRVASGSPL